VSDHTRDLNLGRPLACSLQAFDLSATRARTSCASLRPRFQPAFRPARLVECRLYSTLKILPAKFTNNKLLNNLIKYTWSNQIVWTKIRNLISQILKLFLRKLMDENVIVK
jgi:hypothetical protein